VSCAGLAKKIFYLNNTNKTGFICIICFKTIFCFITSIKKKTVLKQKKSFKTKKKLA